MKKIADKPAAKPAMARLFLGDHAKATEAQVLAELRDEWRAGDKAAKYEVLVAYESVGYWSCNSSAWFLLRLKADRKALFELHGSHCSCYGFEDQFTPEPATVDYLLSDKFSFSAGGYDSEGHEGQNAKVKAWLRENERALRAGRRLS